ncbi:hypothetical protein SERLA73DRAFT_170143 [Serpula lacrymans var. lacrymans S7.3]|uniref:Uncharacterized protein n=2 Tax=Serpula lacrymans var. lacrymans TaxID=341189 RepID=F8Q5B9_SERL3|nr:hypothetical protein SERLA73DRAFT_170143 [Serpula lacrymans var. lacrymans S7.3]
MQDVDESVEEPDMLLLPLDLTRNSLQTVGNGGLPERRSHSLQGIVRRLAVRYTPLPSHLEVLRIGYGPEVSPVVFGADEGHCVERLARAYPCLHEIYLGDLVWRRRGGVWTSAPCVEGLEL